MRGLLASGALKASGPSPGAGVRSALLVLEAPDRAALEEIVAGQLQAR